MYSNPYYSGLFTPTATPNQVQPMMLPPQQIITAKGKASIDTLKLSPNSSVLIADETAPIVWKCTSDGLGNVTSEAFDIVPHKDEEQVQKENMIALVTSMDARLKKLEESYEQSNIRATAPNESAAKSHEQHGNHKESMGNAPEYGESPSYDAEDARKQPEYSRADEVASGFRR